MHEHNGTMEEQLQALYSEREWLAQELGCADAESIIDMVRNMEFQLSDMYKTFGSMPAVSNSQTLQLLQQVQELSQHLDSMYSEKSVTFTIEEDKPVLRANWKQSNTTSEGDQQ